MKWTINRAFGRMVRHSFVFDGRHRRPATDPVNALLDFGRRVQYSVFEAEMDTDSLMRLKKRIHDQVDEAEDSVRIYPHCAACEARIEIIGQGIASQDPEFIII